MVKRYHIIVEGQVQGVGFRSFCIMEAQKRKLTGSVKNLYNGMVEIFVQGEEALIDQFIAKVNEGNRFIHVENMSLKEMDVVLGERGFRYA